MTTDQLFKHLTSEPKWYAGKFSPQIASRIKRQYRKGVYMQDSLVRLFAKFGYTQEQIQWKKSEPIKCNHEYVLPPDSFEKMYCKHCYKEA